MKPPSIRRLSIASIVIAMMAAGMTVPGTAREIRRPSFDGEWSVMIMTDSGPCDQSYRYGLRIAGGRIYYEGSQGVDLSGQVSPSGYVSVRLRRGDAYAVGSGRLAGASGSGRWSGVASSNRCAGRWEAERRAAG